MEEKKKESKSHMSGVKKGAAGFFGKTKAAFVKAVDQNDDGKFDMKDVSNIAGSMGESMKNGASALKDSAEEKMRLLELKALQPIFSDTLDDNDFLMPKFIRIADRDKKRAESEVCKGSIGYFSDQKGLRVVNLFRDSIESFGISFCPDNSSEFYYVDPSDRDTYIALDNYFDYLKSARVNELQMIAQKLGAKHFRVTYKEEMTSFTKRTVKAGAKVNSKVGESAEHEITEVKFSKAEIAAEADYPGCAPVMPNLKYLKRDPSVQALVAMRMDESSPMFHQKLTIKMNTSSGLKESDAVKIDAVLKSMKCSGNTTVASEAKNESRRYLDYEVDFE